MQEIILKQDILKEDYQKALKRELYFFFRSQSLSIDKIIKNQRGLELVTSDHSGYKTSSGKFLYYVLSDQVW